MAETTKLHPDLSKQIEIAALIPQFASLYALVDIVSPYVTQCNALKDRLMALGLDAHDLGQIDFPQPQSILVHRQPCPHPKG